MSKRNISYIKPEEPNFLKRLKKEIGYTEGTTIETKREALAAGPEDLPEVEDEGPQVVVLKDGDLTEEEANKEQERLAQEEQEKPADLNQRVIFKPRSKKKSDDEEEADSKKTKKEKKSRKAANPKPVLSFQDEDDD